MRRGNLLLRG